MSAIIELRNPSDRIYKRVRKFLEKIEFFIDTASARYIAVSYCGTDNITGTEDVLYRLTNVTQSKYRGVLIPPSQSLDEHERASGRVAMVFAEWEGDDAREGLRTMFPALKYENPEKKKN